MNLKFGTGGLRAVMEEGPDYLNITTIREATLGVADYIKKRYKQPRIAICYDSRNKSEEFAQETARVFALKGCMVFIGKTLMPTPFLSYYVRKMNCNLGVCITASHNSKEYNGYKVYGEDGCQITKNAAKEIQAQITNANILEVQKCVSFEDYSNWGKIQFIPESVGDDFCKDILSYGFCDSMGSDLKIVYSPLNGAGKSFVTNVLRQKGFSNVTIVEEQCEPDGNFPTCPYPNPENDDAMKLGMQLCEKIGADIFLATDPDSDRVGVVVKRGNVYKRLNGNQVGVLLLDYILKTKKANGSLPEHPIVIKTIVTTEMVKVIAEDYHVEVVETLTGFKYIGEQIGELAKKGEQDRFVFGVEESCGYLIGTYVRDKDAIGAIMLICEMADVYKKQGKSLWDRMEELYQQYGYYESVSITQNYDKNNFDSYMQKVRKKLHKNELLREFQGGVSRYTDYMEDNEKLPKSDVLKTIFKNGSRLIVRPSGTEPVIKFYLEYKK